MEKIKNAKRIVIKIGSSTLTHESGNINIKRMEELVKVIADLKNAGKEIILVSSGAIAVGAGKLGMSERPEDMPSKQALAAIGQCELMHLYDKMFNEYNQTVAQILLTYYVISGEEKVENVRNTIDRLLKYNVIPIVNENDTISTEEIEVGDNDTLSAIVASIVEADLLILLTDIDGLYNDNPSVNKEAVKIEEVEEIDDYIMSVASNSMSSFGTGGMVTKIKAGEFALANGVDMVILSSFRPANLYDLFEGINTGTWFKCK